MIDDVTKEAPAIPPDFGFPPAWDENGVSFVLSCSPGPPVTHELEGGTDEQEPPATVDPPML